MFVPRVRVILLCLSMVPDIYATGNDMNATQPPMAEIKPHVLEKHGHIRIDNYYWLRERDNPQVLEYLKAENRYTDAVMAPVKQLEQKLFDEMKDRIKQTDLSVPYKMDDYFYYTKYESGKEYPIYCRKRGSLDALEEVMLDGNEMAKGHGFFNIGSTAVSFQQDIVAFTVDTVGRRFYTIRFKDLRSGEIMPDEIRSSTANIAWANDNTTLFYTKQDPATLRAAFSSGKTPLSWGNLYLASVRSEPKGSALELVCGGLPDAPKALMDKWKHGKTATKTLDAIVANLG